MYVYISENTSMEDSSTGSLFWFKEGLRYGDWESCQNGDDSCKMNGTIEISEVMRSNRIAFNSLSSSLSRCILFHGEEYCIHYFKCFNSISILLELRLPSLV